MLPAQRQFKLSPGDRPAKLRLFRLAAPACKTIDHMRFVDPLGLGKLTVVELMARKVGVNISDRR